MKQTQFEGTRPNLPQPLPRSNMAGRKFVQVPGQEYIIDVWPHWTSGDLCWAAYKWNGSAWPKIPCFTRAEEHRFPKTIAKLAHEFTAKLKAIESGEMMV